MNVFIDQVRPIIERHGHGCGIYGVYSRWREICEVYIRSASRIVAAGHDSPADRVGKPARGGDGIGDGVFFVVPEIESVVLDLIAGK